MGETTEEIIAEMKIPDSIFCEIMSNEEKPPKCPVLVFINTKSGGQLGSELLISYQAVLSEKQVTKYC